MKLTNILKESFQELKDRPVYFVPRLASTSISTAWFVYILSSMDIGFYLASAPFIIFLGLFVPVMVAYMVENNAGLLEGFRGTSKRIGDILLASLAFIALGAISALPAVAGSALLYINGNLIAPVVGLSLSVVLMLAIGFSTYFLPITLLREGFTGGFRKSAEFSASNQREVTALIVFSFLLFGVSAASSGALQTAGLIGFVIGRLTSAVVATYLIVVSPKYYLEKEK
ncbi:hypothetical protein [Candidatus Nanohalovita haloferacivicina]|uniref:hypothetical protein n=1 Tax=Candidatus Nanohalovita haloferacivicina TaxID=2978046 RepID=UPI00325FCD61|nr:hypothetical protein HBNXNv_0863 [Candidatus Nanohalobia archaeon BNXNv]